jgi:putative sterol carrier protein
MKSVEEVIQHLDESVDARVARAVNAAYRIETEEGKDLTLELREGHFSLNGHTGKPDCIIRGEEEDLARIFGGEADLLTSVMQGRVQLTGNLQLAQKLVTVLRTRTPERRTSGR